MRGEQLFDRYCNKCHVGGEVALALDIAPLFELPKGAQSRPVLAHGIICAWLMFMLPSSPE